MYVMSQDERRLVNSDYASQFYIEETPDGAKLMAATDVDVVLGTYDKVDHAETVLKFIGTCMVDEDAQGKITQVPTREDMAMSDNLFSGGQGLKKAIAKALSSRGGYPKIMTIRDLTSCHC